MTKIAVCDVKLILKISRSEYLLHPKMLNLKVSKLTDLPKKSCTVSGKQSSK